MRDPGKTTRGRAGAPPLACQRADKKVGAREPGDFRPITCLNTLYKCATGALQFILWRHVAPTGLIPEEQKALQKCRSCLDAM